MMLKLTAKCKTVYKSSTSPAFKNLQAGDLVQFSVAIKAAGHNKSTYATYITCLNLKTGELSNLSFNQIARILANFEWEEQTDDKITCCTWKIGPDCYRITVNDIRYRNFDTGCILDINTLFDTMQELKQRLENETSKTVLFDMRDGTK